MATNYGISAVMESLVSGSSVSHTSGSATLFAATGSNGVQTLYFFKGNGDQVDIGGGSTLTADADSGGTVSVDLSTDTFDIAGGSGVDTTIAKSGTDVTLTIDVDLGEATEAAIDVSTDYGLFLDGGATGTTRKDSWADIATAQAGTVTTTGLAASSGVFNWDLQNWTASTTIVDADLIGVDDGANGTLRKMTRGNFLGSAAAAFSNGMTSTTISGSSTLQVAGATTLGHTVSVIGNFNANSAVTLGNAAADVVTVTGQLTCSQGADLTLVTNHDAGLTSTTISGSGAATLASLHCDSVNLDGGSIDGTTIGGATAAAGTFTTLIGTTVSGSGQISGLKLVLDDDSTIGIASDTDLLTLESGQLDVAGVVSGSGNFQIGGSVTANSHFLPADDNVCDLGTSALEFKDLYLDGTAYVDAMNSAAALVWTLVDNDSDAFSFDTTGKTGILSIDTSNGSEHVLMDGYCQIEGSDGSSNGLILGADGAGVGMKLFGSTANESVVYSAAGHTLTFTDSGNATHITIGGDANGEYAIDVATGSNEKNKIRAAAFVTYSDERLKADVTPIENALGLVNSLNAVNFTWKSDGARDFGFLAQDLQKHIPQAVHGNDEGLFGVDYGRLTSILVSAIQEQSAEIKALKNKLDK